MHKYVWTGNDKNKTITRHATVVLGGISEPTDLTINAVFHGQQPVRQDELLPWDCPNMIVIIGRNTQVQSEDK